MGGRIRAGNCVRPVIDMDASAGLARISSAGGGVARRRAVRHDANADVQLVAQCRRMSVLLSVVVPAVGRAPARVGAVGEAERRAVPGVGTRGPLAGRLEAVQKVLTGVMLLSDHNDPNPNDPNTTRTHVRLHLMRCAVTSPDG